MRFTFSLLCFLLFVVTSESNAQDKYVQKVYGFIERPDDKTGGKLLHTVYIEMLGNSIPIWDTAIIDGSIYVVHASPVDTIPLRVGERKSDNRMVVLKPGAGSKLYKLDFDLVQEQTSADAVATNQAVLLKGSFKNRRITYKVIRETELVPFKGF